MLSGPCVQMVTDRPILQGLCRRFNEVRNKRLETKPTKMKIKKRKTRKNMAMTANVWKISQALTKQFHLKFRHWWPRHLASETGTWTWLLKCISSQRHLVHDYIRYIILKEKSTALSLKCVDKGEESSEPNKHFYVFHCRLYSCNQSLV